MVHTCCAHVHTAAYAAATTSVGVAAAMAAADAYAGDAHRAGVVVAFALALGAFVYDARYFVAERWFGFGTVSRRLDAVSTRVALAYAAAAYALVALRRCDDDANAWALPVAWMAHAALRGASERVDRRERAARARAPDSMAIDEVIVDAEELSSDDSA